MREGRVRVGGEIVREMGSKVAPDARIEVDGHAVAPPAPHRYVVLNKPRGIVSTARDERGRSTVVELIGARERLYPVGPSCTGQHGSSSNASACKASTTCRAP